MVTIFFAFLENFKRLSFSSYYYFLARLVPGWVTIRGWVNHLGM